MRNQTLAALGLLALAGCTQLPPISGPAVVSEHVGRRPDVGVISEVTVGDVAYSQFRYTAKRGYRITETVDRSVGLGRTIVPAGAFLFRSTADGLSAYCTELKTYRDPLAGPITTSCFVDTMNRGQFDVMKVAPGYVWFTYQLSPPVPYAVGEEAVPRQDAFKLELVFQGAAAKTIRLAYREYINDMARPAYAQDVAYDAATLPLVVAFKSARIEVLQVGVSTMTYRVLSGF